MLKYILKAIGSELVSYACFFVFIGAIFGIGYGLHVLFGGAAVAVGLVSVFILVQACIIGDKAFAAKKKEEK